MADPFIWGPGGSRLSATDVARNRKVAEALAARAQNPQNFWEGMQSATGDIGAALLNFQADEAEEKGRSAIADALLQAQNGGDPNAYISILGNEFASPSQSAVAQALLQRQWGKEDREAAQAVPDWQTFESGGDIYRYNERDPNSSPSLFFDGPDAAPELPTSAQEFEYGRQNPEFLDFLKDTKGGVKVDARNMGSIPPGYQVEYDEAGNPVRMIPIPGSPDEVKATQEAEAAAAAAEAQKARQQQTGTIVTQDVDRAIGQIEQLPWLTTGIGAQISSGIGGSPAGNVQELIKSVQANAGFEQLQQMRESSPTGGALGQVTERELAFLQAAVGSLAQSQGDKQLVDNLKRVKNIYLDIIHGPGKGPPREKLSFDEKGGELPEGVTEEDIEYTMQVHGLSREEVLKRLKQ